MPRRKRLTGKELIRALKKAGFAVVRVQGSHHRLRHADARVTTVPVHAGETIGHLISGWVSSAKSCATATSPTISCKRSSDRLRPRCSAAKVSIDEVYQKLKNEVQAAERLRSEFQ